MWPRLRVARARTGWRVWPRASRASAASVADAEAIVRAEGEQPVNDRDQAVGKARADFLDREMRIADPLDEPVFPGQSGEGVRTREQTVHRAAETEEVGPGIDRLISDLLGRHEIGRSDDDAFVGVKHVGCLTGHSDQLTATQVEDLHNSGLHEEQVRRLDIAVNHAL